MLEQDSVSWPSRASLVSYLLALEGNLTGTMELMFITGLHEYTFSALRFLKRYSRISEKKREYKFKTFISKKQDNIQTIRK